MTDKPERVLEGLFRHVEGLDCHILRTKLPYLDRPAFALVRAVLVPHDSEVDTPRVEWAAYVLGRRDDDDEDLIDCCWFASEENSVLTEDQLKHAIESATQRARRALEIMPFENLEPTFIPLQFPCKN